MGGERIEMRHGKRGGMLVSRREAHHYLRGWFWGRFRWSPARGCIMQRAVVRWVAWARTTGTRQQKSANWGLGLSQLDVNYHRGTSIVCKTHRKHGPNYLPLQILVLLSVAFASGSVAPSILGPHYTITFIGGDWADTRRAASHRGGVCVCEGFGPSLYGGLQYEGAVSRVDRRRRWHQHSVPSPQAGPIRYSFPR